MPTMPTDPNLAELIQRFHDTPATDRWARADIANAVRTGHGGAGLAALAKATGKSVSRLRHIARVADTFSGDARKDVERYSFDALEREMAQNNEKTSRRKSKPVGNPTQTKEPNEPNTAAKTLDSLIQRFKAALGRESDSLWTQADTALEIFLQFGRAGLRNLVQATGQSRSRISAVLAVARDIPPELRTEFPHLSFTHFHEARLAAAKFPAGPKSAVTYWLRRANDERWTAGKIRSTSVQESTLILSDPTDSKAQQDWLSRRGAAAREAFDDIKNSIDRFNRIHASYYGVRLVLESVPIADSVA